MTTKAFDQLTENSLEKLYIDNVTVDPSAFEKLVEVEKLKSLYLLNTVRISDSVLEKIVKRYLS